MRSVMPLLALLLIGGSGMASALSAIPTPSKENPFPYLLAFLAVFALIYGAFLAVDWLKERRVGRMKESHDVEGLTKALKNGWLACKAAHALGDMRDTGAVEPLMEALEDRDDNVRQAAAKALGDIGDDRAVKPLMRALGDKYRGVRDCASYALQKICGQCNSL